MLFRERDQTVKIPQARSVVSTADGLLGVAQTLVLVPINLPDFKNCFKSSLAEIKKDFRAAKY